MLNEIKQLARDIFILLGITFLLNSVWEAIDTAQFGSPQPSIADSIFGIVVIVAVWNLIKEKRN